METCIKEICRIQKDEWNGLYMGKLIYRKGLKNCGPYVSRIKEKHLVDISVLGNDGEILKILLLKPIGIIPSEEKLPENAKFWKIFSTSSVKEYSLSIGDHNSLHYRDLPVVSGFQLLSELSLNEEKFTDITMRFFYPIYANEKIYLERNKNVYSGWTSRKCFEVKINV